MQSKSVPFRGVIDAVVRGTETGEQGDGRELDRGPGDGRSRDRKRRGGVSWTEASRTGTAETDGDEDRRTGDRESEQGRATGESGQRPGQQGDGDDQRQGQQNWTRTGSAGRGDRHRRRGELARGRQDAAGESQTALGPMANTGECPKSLRWGHAEALSESRGGFSSPLEAGNQPHTGSGAASYGCWPATVYVGSSYDLVL